MTQQTTDNTLASFEFDHFANILTALVPGFSGGALYDIDHNNICISEGFTESTIEKIEIFLAEQRDNWSSDDSRELQTKRLTADFLLFSNFLINHSDEPIGTLVLLIRLKKDIDLKDLEERMVVATNAIAVIISDRYQLNAELNTMAAELTERYEELNLIYDTADQTNSFSAVKRALQQLVKNCCVYLNVPFAAIMLLDKKVSVYHLTDSQFINSKDFINNELHQLYLWTMDTSMPLVLNNRQDLAWANLKKIFPCKLLSFPITDKSGNCLGVLVVLKEEGTEDFFNSDRNLLMVMSNKASKIIQTNYDSLTGLLNLQAFKYFIGKVHFTSNQLISEEHTLLYIDLDHIQVINDTMSHQAGDEVLRSVGNLIKRLIRDKDIAARLAGDKFGVLLYNCNPERGLTISKRISKKITKLRLKWNGEKIAISACIGLASIDVRSKNVLSALDDAEIACNAAKEEGKNKIRFFKFGDIDHTRLKDEMRWAQMLQDSLSRNNLLLYCQKIHALNGTSTTLHYEILLRALDSAGEIQEPKKFIPAAERYKIMPSVDRWVISNTLKILQKHQEDFQDKQVIWSINISGQSFRDETFLDFIVTSLQSSGLPPASICFEITETAAIGNLIAAQKLIKSLQGLGCTIALDDFGSGLSSFTYLKNLQVDYLKIDGSIVKDIVEDHIARAMVKAIMDVAEALEIETIGEFVENSAIAEQLSNLQIDYGQGYHFGRPLPLENELKNIITGKGD